MILNNINKENAFKDFNEAIILMYKEMIRSANSSRKVKPLHKWMAKYLQEILGKDFEVFASGFNSYNNKNEVNIPGKYINKNVDVAIFSKKIKKFVGIIEIKAPMNSVGKNISNHFENLLGYTANIRSNNLVFGHFNIYRQYSPIFGKNSINKNSSPNYLKKIEELKIEKLQGFSKLMREPKSIMHRPDALMIHIINFNNTWIYEKYLEQQIYKDKNAVEELINHVNIKSIDILRQNFEDGISNNPVEFIIHFALLCLTKATDLF